MLTHFEVSNFKSIKHLDLAMRPFMVLVGPNGAGKTNVVQAMDLLGAMLEQGSIEPVRAAGYDEIIRREKTTARTGLTLGATIRTTQRELFIGTKPSRPEISRNKSPIDLAVRIVVKGPAKAPHVEEETLTLRQGDEEVVVSFGAKNVRVRIDAKAGLIDLVRDVLQLRGVRPGANGQRRRGDLDHRTSVEAEFEDGLQQRANIRGDRWLEISRRISRGILVRCFVERIRLDASALRQDALLKDRIYSFGFIGPAGEGLALAVEHLRGDSKRAGPAFKPLLQKLQEVYPRIEDVATARIPGRVVLYFKERGISEQLGQANVSDGVLHSLALLVALDANGLGLGVVAIEEPENAIHPWPLRKIIEGAQEDRRGTLIITTHSPTVVNAIKDPDSLFIVEQTGNKGTTVTPARDREHALDTILNESGEKLGDIWLGGSLGGVPTSE